MTKTNEEILAFIEGIIKREEGFLNRNPYSSDNLSYSSTIIHAVLEIKNYITGK